jgi:pimeloyl-ACP methyl ester carboxylesterase
MDAPKAGELRSPVFSCARFSRAMRYHAGMALRPFSERVNGIVLTGIEGGPRTGEPVVLLHGFPEFWYSWRHQIPALADAGFYVIAPNLRGYDTSSKPPSVSDYTIDRLSQDVFELIERKCNGRAHVVGHDWGGVIAWHLAMAHAQCIDRLAILNAPHPLAFRREFLRTSQWLRSGYMLFFQFPWIPETLLRWTDYRLIRRTLRAGPARDSAASVNLYITALSRPHALESMINYYRAIVRSDAAQLVARIDVPTIMLWGDRDPYLAPQLTEGLHGAVSKLRVMRFLNAGHWVHHDEPAWVNAQLIKHFTAGNQSIPAAVESAYADGERLRS